MLTPLQNNTRDAYIKNYTFDFDFGPPWGHCSVTMTAVKGHLTAVEFPGEYKQWEYPPPDRLFDAPVLTVIPNVSGTLADLSEPCAADADSRGRTTSRSPRTLRTRRDAPVRWSFGPIAIARASTSAARSGPLRGRATPRSRSSGRGLATSRERRSPLLSLPSSAKCF